MLLVWLFAHFLTTLCCASRVNNFNNTPDTGLAHYKYDSDSDDLSTENSSRAPVPETWTSCTNDFFPDIEASDDSLAFLDGLIEMYEKSENVENWPETSSSYLNADHSQISAISEELLHVQDTNANYYKAMRKHIHDTLLEKYNQSIAPHMSRTIHWDYVDVIGWPSCIKVYDLHYLSDTQCDNLLQHLPNISFRNGSITSKHFRARNRRGNKEFHRKLLAALQEINWPTKQRIFWNDIHHEVPDTWC